MSDSESEVNLETLKQVAFLAKPMGNKNIREIPGVGQKTASFLKHINCDKASDMYDVLKSLYFEERLLRDWLTRRCPGAKVHTETIYAALMEYHRKYGHLHTTNYGVQTPHGNTSDSNITNVHEVDSLAPFFMSLADSYKTISKPAQTALKMDMYNVVQKYSRGRQNEPT